MYHRNCFPVPYTYEQCMANCQSLGGYSYECEMPCRQYKTRPWYMKCTGHMTYTPTTLYSMSQPAHYSPQPYSYPVSPFYPVNPMTYFIKCPEGQTPVKVCDGPFSCYLECKTLIP
ncbi:hypothetical protein [Bacillus pseudomycoides]|uniref:hypothetical protein n=1 Tax=Bacillus pseudomycoides TaxID=64104 RepID=UPI0011454E90|nr:hypothetical protein [Bacillus pseudomycoides]